MQFFALMHTNANFSYAMQIGFMLPVLLLLRWYRKRHNHPPSVLDLAITTLLRTLPFGLIMLFIASVFLKL